jgi:hypothetical protein
VSGQSSPNSKAYQREQRQSEEGIKGALAKID